MSEYPWNEKNNTFTWLSLLFNPFKMNWETTLRRLIFELIHFREISFRVDLFSPLQNIAIFRVDFFSRYVMFRSTSTDKIFEKNSSFHVK